MPAVREGLREMFGLSRLRLAENAATLIAEGAAWIAYDDVGLQLAKPMELLHADESFVQLFPTGTVLPEAGKVVQAPPLALYCVIPGTARPCSTSRVRSGRAATAAATGASRTCTFRSPSTSTAGRSWSGCGWR